MSQQLMQVMSTLSAKRITKSWNSQQEQQYCERLIIFKSHILKDDSGISLTFLFKLAFFVTCVWCVQTAKLLYADANYRFVEIFPYGIVMLAGAPP
jgi:hypothetical protein